MDTEQVIAFFGGRVLELAIAFDPPLHPQAIYKWGKKVPPLRQMQLQIMTGGALRADPGIIPTYRIERQFVGDDTLFRRVYDERSYDRSISDGPAGNGTTTPLEGGTE